ncbi:hypothetical protein J7I98_29025 [Streptomyces sp. ISL-98]|uniref:DUF6507 family protein n=1 Tax=Streptomyces sp. ISL-98 TaxID=2819192 RepID=UPI001BEAD89E|nr:DUF6507 family protein [Streptomyces sp. ISL-98]MBT2509838.1 hypothetical protein [Streptomyces sp. ISL-98]
MTGWDLEPAGVKGALAVTSVSVDSLPGQVKAFATDLESAAKWAGTLSQEGSDGDGTAGLVGAALMQFALARREQLVFMQRRAVKSVNGARAALAAYEAGNLEMAHTVQQEALKAPTIPDLNLPGVDGESAK